AVVPVKSRSSPSAMSHPRWRVWRARRRPAARRRCPRPRGPPRRPRGKAREKATRDDWLRPFLDATRGAGYTSDPDVLKIVGVLPARYASVRFPGKPLASIAGKPMILRVLEAGM